MASLGLRTATRIAARDRIPTRAAYRPIANLSMVQSKESPKLTTSPGRRAGVSGGREKLDRWIRQSVGEIVKNLEEAPLFVHVYGDGGVVKTEKAVAENWGELKGRWVKGEEASPEGMILVEELEEVFDEEEEGLIGEFTKAWGVLIQGRGEDGGVGCYLLKTCKVGSPNLGLFCTHFSLVKVKSFRETAKSQLTKCWLV